MNTAGDYLTVGAGANVWRLPDRDTVTIGRDPSCDLCLHTDDRVSRRHVELQRADGRWWIIDRSTNGSYVNGLRIRQQPLNDGDRVQLGSSEFTFHSGGQTTAESPKSEQPSRGLGGKMAVAGILQVLHLGLNSLLTFVTDLSSGPTRWIISQTAVIVIAMVMTGAGAMAERAPAPATSGGGRAPQQRVGRSGLAVFLVVVLVLGVGGFAATQGVRYVVDYTTGKETGTDRLVSQASKSAAGLTLTVVKVEYTSHFTRVELTARNSTSANSITLPLFENCVFTAADGTTLRADSFRSQWSQTVPPGAFQRGTITFPDHLPDTTTRASLSFSHIFGTFDATAISVSGITLRTG